MVRILKNKKALLVLLVMPILAVSSLVAVPLAHASTITIPSSAQLNSITLTSYNGADSSGISDLVAGKILAYDFAATPSELSTVPSSFDQYKAPASWYGLEVNPTNTADGFNPFQYQQVRFALNYLVNRNYFVGTLLGGNAIPTVSVFGGEPDQLVTAAATAPYANITYSVTAANSSIYNTLKGISGVTFKWASNPATTPEWSYKGKTITVSIFDRTDDPVRHAFDGYLATQLESIGFAVTLIPGSLSTAETTVYGTDPANATWDIYPASYGDVYSYYDEGFAELYAPIAGAIPASSAQGLAFGTYNDTAEEQPSTVALLNTADTQALNFFNTNFTSFAQRNADLSTLTAAGVKAAVVIGIATSLNPYIASPSLQGVTTNFLNDPLLNGISFLTMNTASGTADIGVRYLAESSLNPIGGYTDTYSVTWSEATQFPPVAYQPSTGYPYANGWSFKVLGDNPNPTISVPTSAVIMNATSDKFVNVASGTTAKTAVIANFAPMLQQSWQDGQPVTLADILYQYILAGEVTQNPNSPYYDGYSAAVFGPSWQTIVGLSIVNSTSIEIYSTFYYPDTYFAGINAAGAIFAFTTTSGAQGMLPWQVYAGMANLVGSGKDAFSTSTATAKNLPWLSLVNPTDVSNLNTVMNTYASSSFIPPEFASLQSLTGTTLVTAAQAAAGYKAASTFIGKYGNGIVGNGPFILTTYSSSTSPAYLTLTKNSAYTWGNQMNTNLAQAPVLLSAQAQIPPVMSPGQSITVTAVQTAEGTGTTSPAAGANVTLQLIYNGAVAYQGSFLTGSTGTVSVTIPSTLATGTYVLSIYTASAGSTLYNPLVETVQLSPSTTTTTSSSLTTASQTTTSTTTTTSSTSTTTSLSPTVIGVVTLVTAVAAASLAIGRSKRRGDSERFQSTRLN